ncbi:MAG: hypothetical protein U5K75_02295 [Ahrensia sp.]|nr:hypothetical protein [Ahrensia sp.]
MSDTKKDFTGVRAKLKKYADDHSAPKTKTLPQSGISVAIPTFINHGLWMAAQRQAQGDVAKAQAAFVISAVTFEGEKLTMADVQAGLLDAKDMLFLIGEVFGDGDGDVEEKKTETLAAEAILAD